ncbi:MAG: hypothetical protein NTV72_01360 [Candidatus Taylorbacteria bacterium]|nr:hypothetical protein [Candidatus Taylorbacteria bacterium]
MQLTKEKIEKAISEIRKEIKNFQISKKALVKFTDSETDKEFLSYIDGVGGYALKFLPSIIEKLGIKSVLELGNKEGVSTLCIWDHLPKDGKMITVDIDKDQRYCPDAMFKDPRVKFVFGDVSNPNIYEKVFPENIEFMYMDTIHYFFQASDEFAVNKHFLADKALVAVDDINLNDKRKFFDGLKYTKWDMTDLCHASGWGLFLFERDKEKTFEEKVKDAYIEATRIGFRKCEESERKVNELKNKQLSKRIKDVLKKNKVTYKLGISISNFIKKFK